MLKYREHFALPVKEKVLKLNKEEQLNLLDHILHIVSGLNNSGIIEPQRTCFACTHFERNQNGSYCSLLKQPLKRVDIRFDCPEFELAVH